MPDVDTRRRSRPQTALFTLGRGGLAGAALIGIYTLVAARPACAGFYTCTRVVDRTLLLGWTATVVAPAVIVAVTLADLMWARLPVWCRYTVRLLLVGGAVVLVVAYQITDFPSLRADMTTVVAATPSTWTASGALWLTALGSLLSGLTVGSLTRPL